MIYGFEPTNEEINKIVPPPEVITESSIIELNATVSNTDSLYTVVDNIENTNEVNHKMYFCF